MTNVILFDDNGVILNGCPFSVLLEEKYNIKTENTAYFFETELTNFWDGQEDIKDVLPHYLKEWGWKKAQMIF